MRKRKEEGTGRGGIVPREEGRGEGGRGDGGGKSREEGEGAVRTEEEERGGEGGRTEGRRAARLAPSSESARFAPLSKVEALSCRICAQTSSAVK